MRRDSNTTSSAQRLKREDGVSLIMVALSIFVLTGFLVVVLDYGVLWTARRQAQNAADAGALAGAVARSFDETADPPAANGIAYQAAVAAAQANNVFGEDGGVVVSWDCPAYAAGGICVRVDVHRDGANIDGVAGADSNPLPVFFAHLFGINSQNVRATATAWVATGNTTNCMRPFAVADRWNDIVDPTLTPPEFTRWDTSGNDAGTELSPKDVYVPQNSSSDGTGYTVEDHLGAQVFLKTGNNPNSAANGMTPGWSLPVRLPDGEGDYVSGGADFNNAIKYCIGNPVTVGDYLPLESGVMVGPTQQGVDEEPTGDEDSLVEQDLNAKWDTGTKTVVDTCAPGCAPFSPRIVPVAVFDQDEYQWRTAANNWTDSWTPGVGPNLGAGGFSCPIGGRCIRVVNIIGFFVEGMAGQDVMGRVVMYPGDFTTGGGEVSGGASFLKTIQLIR